MLNQAELVIYKELGESKNLQKIHKLQGFFNINP